MISDKEYIENKITKYLRKKDEVLFAYIFGSFVNKDYYHDIDIAVYLKNDFNKNDFNKYPYGYESLIIVELNKLVKKEIDFVVMNKAEISFQQRIINRGKLLFCRDDLMRIRYENYIRKCYIDVERIRKIKRKYLSKKITNA